MDEVLLRLSQDALEKAGFPTKALCGRLTFKPEDKILIASDEEVKHEIPDFIIETPESIKL